MGMGGGGSGGQTAVMSGPTVSAANAAAAAQINAANMASQTATQNTNSAIQALMNQYGTGLQILRPAIQTGNQAAAQINYMLGMPAVAPGDAPKTVDLASERAKINEDQINNYINQHTNYLGAPGGTKVSAGNPGGKAGGASEFLHPSYTGVGSSDAALQAQYAKQWNQAVASGGTTAQYPGGLTSTANTSGSGFMGSTIFGQNEGIKNSVTDYLANQALQNDLPAYQQQMDSWNAANSLYNNYTQKGQATAADIGDVVQNLPGYQFQFNQGVNGIQNAASASGMLNSGSLLRNLDQFGQGMASNYYQNYLNNLQGLAGLGSGATQQAAAGANQVGAGIGNAYDNLTSNVGNAYLAAGQAAASSYLSPVQNQQFKTQSLGGGGGDGLGSMLGGMGGLLSGLSGFSDETLKDKIETPSTETILEAVNKLRIDKWKYKGTVEEHVGPYAQEFKDLFKVGDGQSINMLDMFGVMLGAIKELSKQVNELKAGK